jgi:hypothetical protein
MYHGIHLMYQVNVIHDGLDNTILNTILDTVIHDGLDNTILNTIRYTSWIKSTVYIMDHRIRPHLLTLPLVDPHKYSSNHTQIQP